MRRKNMLSVSIRGIISHIRQKVKVERSIYLILFLYILITLLVTGNASAEVKNPPESIDKCNAEIGAPVPEFFCNQGVEVPKTVDANGKCPNPEILRNRCVFKSKLGRLKASNKDVDIIFSCRKDHRSDELHQNSSDNNYWDIAVIQHNRKTGKTCFYQYLGPNRDGDKIIEASNTVKGKEFWAPESVNYCTSCHSNGPFVRSPHYWEFDLKGNRLPTGQKGKRVLPNEGTIDDNLYQVVHKHYKVANVSKSGNDCNMCHNIGGYNRDENATTTSPGWEIGEINELAAGKIKSVGINGGVDAPTTSRYHAFMAKRGGIGGRKEAKAALKELKNCLANPNDTGCTVTLLPNLIPTAAKMKGVLLYVRNDTNSNSNSTLVTTGNFAPICGEDDSSDEDNSPRLPGLDLVRKFTGNEACPGTSDNNRFDSQPNFVFLIDDTSPLSNYLTNYFQSQNLLQDMDGRKVIAPGTRVFQLRGLSIKMLFVGEMAYRKGNSNPSNWFNALNTTPDTPFAVAGP